MGAPAQPQASAQAASAFLKQSSGGFTRPAPTWPTPGSLCAMPVLMIGRMPVSMTLSRSMPVALPRKLSAGILYAWPSPTVISYICVE